MKKYLSSAICILLLAITMAFTFTTPLPKKANDKSKEKTKQPSDLQCSCGIPTGVVANLSGGIVTVNWSVVTGAVSYSVGGYFSNGATFFICAGTNSCTFPSSYHGTLRITANCNGTNCSNATCSGNPSAPATF